MSNTVDDMNKQLIEAQERLRQDEELKEKKKILESHQVNAAIDKLKEREQEQEHIKTIRFDQLSQQCVENIRKENADYLQAAKECMSFITDEFNGTVPFFRKNLILMGATSGEGKSTAVANIVYSTIRQKNPNTGQRRRALVISNEEKPEDVYNRVTCLINNWAYINHDKFTSEQTRAFDEFLPRLAGGGLLTVIDSKYDGCSGLTTTLEGICTIFDNLIRDKVYYDVVLIDYFSNISESTMNPKMTPPEVLTRLAHKLDHYKNVYPAPIVVMAQLHPIKKDDDKTPFEFRIKGRKSILEPCTVAMEMVADRENMRTKWVIHKNRFASNSVGQSFYTGYDWGKFVPYDDKFKAKVCQQREAKAHRLATGGKTKEKK